MSQLACKWYARLESESRDRDLRGFERRFVESHRRQCDACAEESDSASMALNMLRGMAYTDEDLAVTPGFDERIIRQVQVNTVRDGLRYWSPAVLGAVAAMCALFAAMHVAATPSQLQEAKVPGGQARNMSPRPYPSLELEQIPTFRR